MNIPDKLDTGDTPLTEGGGPANPYLMMTEFSWEIDPVGFRAAIKCLKTDKSCL